MIFDWDDMHDSNHRLELFHILKRVNPKFRATVFAVPAYCSPEFLESLPDWLEVVPHGWKHGGRDCSDPREAEHWTYTDALAAMYDLHPRFVMGWKSPGWQISDGTYQALIKLGRWCADHPENNRRRPEGLPTHVLSTPPAHFHGHVQNVCGNGLEETWPEVVRMVADAESFELISEVVQPWQSRAA